MFALPASTTPTGILRGVSAARKAAKWRTKLWLKTTFSPEFDDYPSTCQVPLDKPLWAATARDAESQGVDTSNDNWDAPWRLQLISQTGLVGSCHGNQKSAARSESTSPETEDTAVQLAIGRHGDLIVVRGRDPILKARMAGMATVPARIVLRHPRWVRFCKQFRCFLRTEPGGQAYQPVTHVDLRHLSASWSENRFRIIAESLHGGSGRLMDIGANLGYFCHRAEEMGYDCVAIEACPRLAYFANRLRRADNRRFLVVNDSVLDYPFHETLDVVLALNVFHHFLKTKKRYEAFLAMLERMKTRQMIFQAHRVNEPQMRGAYRDFAPEAFVRFILANSRLSSFEEIGIDRDRRLFQLSDD